MKDWNVVIDYMGNERWISIEAETAEQAEKKFLRAFPQYVRVKRVEEDKF